MAASSDKTQIGLTPAGSAALTALMEAELFDAEGDAYKFAVAYAMAKDLDPASAPTGGYQTKFNAAGGLDRDGLVRDLIATLRPDDSDRPYATAERLAEVGLVELARRVGEHESFGAIAKELSGDAGAVTEVPTA